MERNPAEKPPKYVGVAVEINTLARLDQEAREKQVQEGGAPDLVLTADKRNTNRFKGIVKEMGGWPTIGKVGKESSARAWLLVQHADHDIAFQEECLALMKQEPEDEVDPENIVMLEERIRVNKSAA